MSDLLKITKTEGKVTILHLEGVLDGQTEKGFVDAAHAEFEAGKTTLLLDFGKLDIITSAGLRALQNLYKKFNIFNILLIKYYKITKKYKSLITDHNIIVLIVATYF